MIQMEDDVQRRRKMKEMNEGDSSILSMVIMWSPPTHSKSQKGELFCEQSPKGDFCSAPPHAS